MSRWYVNILFGFKYVNLIHLKMKGYHRSIKRRFCKSKGASRSHCANPFETCWQHLSFVLTIGFWPLTRGQPNLLTSDEASASKFSVWTKQGRPVCPSLVSLTKAKDESGGPCMLSAWLTLWALELLFLLQRKSVNTSNLLFPMQLQVAFFQISSGRDAKFKWKDCARRLPCCCKAPKPVYTCQTTTRLLVPLLSQQGFRAEC